MAVFKKIIFTAFIGLCAGCGFFVSDEPGSILDLKPAAGVKSVIGSERYSSPVIWMSLYYQDPEAARFPVVLKQLEDQGFLSSANAQDYVTAFLIVLLRENPSKADFSLVNTLADADYFDEDAEGIISSAFWLTGTPECIGGLKIMARRNPAFGRFLGMPAPSPELGDILDEPGLNIAWGYFHATGDLSYLRKIVNCLDEDQYRKHKEIKLKKVNQLAVYMLADNCYTDPLVLAYCQKRLAGDCPDAMRYDLERVVNIAAMRKQKAEDDALEARVLGEAKKTEAKKNEKLLPITDHINDIGMEQNRSSVRPPSWRNGSK